MWHQTTISLRPRRRGFHLVGQEIIAALPEIGELRAGLLHLLLQHTSASLSLNENADPDVRTDMRAWIDRTAREDESYYVHTLEGSDDMPAHIKSALFGCEVTIPIRDGRLWLGTWQGLWLGEHRNGAGARRIAATLTGEPR